LSSGKSFIGKRKKFIFNAFVQMVSSEAPSLTSADV